MHYALVFFALLPTLLVFSEEYKGFQITKRTHFDDIQCEMVEAVHEASGLEVLAIQTIDQENLFSFAFRTIPTSSNGVAHVLEHSLLGGSARYPLSRSILPLLRQRSVATNMNAATGADFTFYWATSELEEDFYNVFRVYFDAVFHPLLEPLTFSREAYRLEFQIPDDPTSELTYKGIVYNEMKGALSSPQELLNEEIASLVFPDTAYKYSSGGKPFEITSLTLDELKRFYELHYHPANCLLFFYGNIPIEKHLDELATLELDKLPKHAKVDSIPLQPRFSKRVHKEIRYPSVIDDNGSMIALNFLTCSLKDSKELLALTILDDILMGSDIGLLKSFLINSGLCSEASSTVGDHRQEVLYTLWLVGCNPDDAEAIEKLIYEFLSEIANQGIPEELLDISLHKQEINACEVGKGHEPIEISPFVHCALRKLHGGDPADGLARSAKFAAFRNDAMHPQFFRSIIYNQLIDNPHFVRLIATPDRQLGQKEQELEKEVLEHKKETLSAKEKKNIVKLSNQFKQREIFDLSFLPKITLASIPTNGKHIEYSSHTFPGFNLYVTEAYTNSICYADIFFDLPEMQDEDLWLARLYSSLLAQLGNGNRSYRDSLKYVAKYTGGIQAGFTFFDNHPKFFITGQALERNAPYLFRIFYYMTQSPNFKDKARLKELIWKECHKVESSLQENPLSFAVHESLQAGNWSGLGYYSKIKDLKANFDTRIDDLIVQLEMWHQELMSHKAPDLVLTMNPSSTSTLLHSDFGGLSYLTHIDKLAHSKTHFPSQAMAFAHEIASPVAFTAQSFHTIGLSHPDSALLHIAACLMTNKVLSPKIREEGGAYGGSAIYLPASGHFSLISYRDPALVTTLRAFSEAIYSIAKGAFSDEEVEQAKLEVIQLVDASIPPSRLAQVAYLKVILGTTNAEEDAFRTKLLTATKAEIVQAARCHLVPGFKQSNLATFAGRELLEKELSKLHLSASYSNK